MPSDSRSGKDRDNKRGRNQPRASWREGTQRSDSPIQPKQPSSRSSSSAGSSERISHKWRDIQRETSTEQELPPLPGQHPRRSGSGSNKAIIFGAVLLVLVAALLIVPFSGVLDEDDPEPTPTTVAALSTAAPTEVPSGDATEAPTHAPADTVESDFLVCIDPGHGGWDYGRERMDIAQFPAPYFHESEVTLSMSFHLRDELESRGIGVVMTRETGGAVNWRNDDVNGDGQVLDETDQGKIAGQRDELQARINICNEAGADIMVSVHLNGFDDQSVSGYEVFYNSQREFAQQNQDLAVFIYREMTVAFDELGYAASPRGATDDINLSANVHEYGSEQFPLMIGPEVRKPEYTIIPTAMPGVIIETLFVTNQNDANFILNPANQQRLAVGWADGIENYRERYGDGGE